MAALTEGGLMMLQQCRDQEERERSGKKWESFLKDAWGTMHGKITERMQEMGTFIDQDVRNKLNGVCEISRVDVGAD